MVKNSNETVNLILKYLCGNITPNELEEKLPDLNNSQWHKLAIIRIAYEDSKNQGFFY